MIIKLLTIILLASLAKPPTYTQPIQKGWATHYAEGVMDGVIYVRQGMNHIPEQVEHYAGFIAVNDCRRIGEVAFIAFEDGPFELFLITDCAGRDAYDEEGVSWMTKQNVLAEVDWETCVRWESCGGGARIRMFYAPDIDPWDYTVKDRRKTKFKDEMK